MYVEILKNKVQNQGAQKSIIYDKAAKNIQRGKDNLFNTWLGKMNGQMQKNKTGPWSYTTHKNALKLDQRFECKASNYKTPGRIVWENLLDFDLGNDIFLDLTPKAKAQKLK